jgi:hypothetical protein
MAAWIQRSDDPGLRECSASPGGKTRSQPWAGITGPLTRSVSVSVSRNSKTPSRSWRPGDPDLWLGFVSPGGKARGSLEVGIPDHRETDTTPCNDA